MYVHLGGDVSISDRYILAILDLDSLVNSREGDLGFLESIERSEGLEILSENIPQSLILTLDRIYLSPLPVKLLAERLRSAREMVMRRKK
ncbi:MAG: hypothetical protein Q4P65_01380 [Eubacteriales bacterium]|nr:hypothetical protein [Eubacteriales bacterium]